MSEFERLHPAIQHHVVNSLGWPGLRPLQEEAIQPVIAGRHALLLAPTAGGKTEAAVLPVFSRMLSESWIGLSVIYLCPIKALLNDLEHRLRGYASLFGRSVGVWHGDVGASQRKRLREEPPDILLATPESVEVMLDSRLTDHHRLFHALRTVIVDEIHAFAGDDRGWHLLGVLGRIDGIAPKPVQRLGLSATVGNAKSLLSWFTGGTQGTSQVIAPDSGFRSAPNITLDFVGNIANAALVISRLHRGEKRLVFCDSRRQVETLAVHLREQGVDTYVSHSSLAHDERRRAETAFSESRDCVIVATSTLELGIDVGDLDRLIQIDAPGSVASFLQRLGRTGRRTGKRNCLFLAITQIGLLRTLGLLHLWRRGFVEPIKPPQFPIHVLAQQMLAILLQEGKMPVDDLRWWLGPFLQATEIDEAQFEQLLFGLLEKEVIFQADGLVSMGNKGEELYGRKNFLELFSVFLAPPLFSVFQGRTEIGSLDVSALKRPEGEAIHLTLAGRGWRVTYVDWMRRKVWVEASKELGTSRWSGSTQGLSWYLSQAVRRELVDASVIDLLSQRGLEVLREVQEEFDWLDSDGSYWHETSDDHVWWTFAGSSANNALGSIVRSHFGACSTDAWRIKFKNNRAVSIKTFDELLLAIEAEGVVAPFENASRYYKFVDLLTPELREIFELNRGSWLSQDQVAKLSPVKFVRP